MPLKCVTPEEFNKGVWYTIDPGIHTAVQKWINGEMDKSVVINFGKEKEFANKLSRITDEIDNISNEIGSVIIEGVSLRTGSAVSMASGARGNLFLLAYIVGAIMCKFNMDGHRVYDPILYQEWAGQLSYTQLRHILKVKFNCECPNEHIAAARGIGFAAKGLL